MDNDDEEAFDRPEGCTCTQPHQVCAACAGKPRLQVRSSQFYTRRALDLFSAISRWTVNRWRQITYHDVLTRRPDRAQSNRLGGTGNTLYILDEPTTGLHFDDIRQLLLVLNTLVDRGNTVLVIEHNMDVIKTADWIIDLGPEGGDEGGRVVAAGTPEQVAKVENSYTGQFLKKELGLE